MYEYKASVIKVYDGDTITAQVDLGFHFNFTNSFRLARIDCPEVRGESREEGLKSRDRLRELIMGKDIIIKTIKDRTEKYGRYLAEVYINIDDIEVNINDLLVTEGLAIYKDY
jgi:micrococcal nuclease